uniref:G-protein coupled receptors family 1 profile domain-containing protein n=1 Tax=Arion vulgaris TaxID=1028688 RepID=A0A0B6ZAB3_9EUPU
MQKRKKTPDNKSSIFKYIISQTEQDAIIINIIIDMTIVPLLLSVFRISNEYAC